MSPLTMRPYQGETDYWSIRACLRDVFLRTYPHEIGWQTSRFDYWRCHLVDNAGAITASLAETIFLWETPAGQLAAVLNPNSQDEATLTIHPDFHSSELEDTMIAVGEQRLGTPGQRFFVLVHDQAPARQDILRQRGYAEAGGTVETLWRRDLTTPLPEVSVPVGYHVRAIGDIGGPDWPQRSWVSWRAFHPDEPDADYGGWEWSLNWSRSPLYRQQLDIVAAAPDGQIAAYCVLWYDDVTRTGLFDPVAVMPEHQRRGLGRAIITEALHRAKNMGARLATVGGYEPGANALYGSLFPQCDRNVPWVKML